MNWEPGTDIYTLLMIYIKQITNEKLLCSAGNSTQCSLPEWEDNLKKRGMCICMVDSLCCIVEINNTVKQLYSNKNEFKSYLI